MQYCFCPKIPQAESRMRNKYSRIPEAPDKRLAPILRPVLLVIKRRSVPNHLVEQLRHAHWMRCRTRAPSLKSAVFGVRHVCHVVWRVEIDAVPAAENRPH